MVLGNKRLWLGILLLSKLLWNVAIASTVRSHSKGDTDSREDTALSDEDGAAAVSRRIMRAEKTQEESVEVPAAGLEKTVPFDDVLFNVTVTQPPFAQSSESSQHAGEQQDCRWYDWSPWSYCSKSCGQGWKSRKRTVALQPRHGGLECDGASEDFDHCNEVDCPVDCGWGVWSDWSHCTASCDGGTRQRGKPIKVQNNSLGKPCNMAEGIQVEDCGTSPCPRDCTWADWTKWGECSTTCAGGVKLRSRSIAEAAIADGKKCEGATQDEEVCNVKACPTDCVLADWSNWKACSVTCGNGTSLRERKVLVKEESGGRPCSEPLEEEVPCTEKVCPVDCSWGDWSHWSHCSQTCGSNVSLWATSTRKRLVKESAGGRPCDGEDEQKKLCGQKPCPIDCVWADWNEWKACTKSCGAGITDRLRNISTPAAHGGKECFGSTRDVKTCNEEMCPQDCSGIRGPVMLIGNSGPNAAGHVVRGLPSAIASLIRQLHGAVKSASVRNMRRGAATALTASQRRS